jgi:hypothetical protein
MKRILGEVLPGYLSQVASHVSTVSHGLMFQSTNLPFQVRHLINIFS